MSSTLDIDSDSTQPGVQCGSVKYNNDVYGIGPKDDGDTCDISCVCPLAMTPVFLREHWRCSPPDLDKHTTCPLIKNVSSPKPAAECANDWIAPTGNDADRCKGVQYSDGYYGLGSHSDEACSLSCKCPTGKRIYRHQEHNQWMCVNNDREYDPCAPGARYIEEAAPSLISLGAWNQINWYVSAADADKADLATLWITQNSQPLPV